MNFGKAIAFFREQRGMSAEDLSIATGLGLYGVERFESGEFQPKLKTVVKFARGLGVKASTLIAKAEDMEDE